VTVRPGELRADADLIHYTMGASEKDDGETICKAMDFPTTARRQTVDGAGLPFEEGVNQSLLVSTPSVRRRGFFLSWLRGLPSSPPSRRPAVRWRFLSQGNGRLGGPAVNGWVKRPTGRDSFLTGDGPAANWQPRQAAGVFGFLSSQHGPKLNKVVAALGGDVVAHAPDFFQNLVFHSGIIPSTRVVCR
jgi:hypothetical protein